MKIVNLTLLLAVSAALLSCRSADERAAQALARRVMGEKASAVAFEQTDSPTDSYELVQRGSKVLIRGNNANSMAVGLNRYIQEYCLANARRQALRNRALPVRERFTAAYKAGDRAGMVAASEEFLGLCDQLVAVLRTRPEFSLDGWIRDAREWGSTPEEKDYFERNARTIITVWGDSPHLSDYANRDWDGLVETFYKVRWQLFFDAVLAAFDAGEAFDNRPLDEAIRAFECQWAHMEQPSTQQ